MKKTAIIGGGFSGLICAIILSADKNNDITIFERQDMPGKKILMTGNGRCNLSNQYVCDSGRYFSYTPQKKDYISPMSADDLISFFNSIGLITTNKNEYIYPYSLRADSVRDILLGALSDRNVRLVTDTYIDSLTPLNGKGFGIMNESFDYAVICTGGRAGVYKEEAYSGYELLRGLGLKSTLTFPALTGCECVGDFNKLKGVRTEAKVILKSAERIIAADKGELQFTEYGLSGIPVFNITAHMNTAKNEEIFFDIDYFESYSIYELTIVIKNILEIYPELSVSDALKGLMNRKIFDYILSEMHFPNTATAGKCDDNFASELAGRLKSHKILFKKLRGYKYAQIMRGGIDLGEIDKHFMSVKYPGLYIAGEALDISGECGGFNLHFAFHSAKTIGESINLC